MPRAKATATSLRPAKTKAAAESASRVRQRSEASEKQQIANMLRRINRKLDEVEAQADRLLANAK